MASRRRVCLVSIAASFAALAVSPSVFAGGSGSINMLLLRGTKAEPDITLDKGFTATVAGPQQDGSGVAEIISNTITIDGTLSALGEGPIGMAGMNGGNPGGGKAGNAAPGGGGGFFGDGGPGSSLTGMPMKCGVPTGAGAGGKAFAKLDGLDMLVGSAGGGAGIFAGGPGGGHIILKAATIIVDGTITADGTGPAGSGTQLPGGGSGGVIEIFAFELKGTGKITARGGDGAQSGQVGGGGGAGGIISITAKTIASSLDIDVSGGKSACALGTGTAGKIQKATQDCIDADGDGVPAAVCAPKGKPGDCDDSNPKVKPGATEVCNGIDDDCNGKIDDDLPPDACGKNQICKGGMCVSGEADAGPSDAGPVGSTPDHIDFAGGCDVSPIATSTGLVASALSLIAGFALVMRSRRRK